MRSAVAVASSRWIVPLVVALGFAGVFVLPWFVPVVTAPLVSDSQAVGFSNRTAVLALAAAAVVLGVTAYVRGPRDRGRSGIEDASAGPLDKRTVALALVGTVAFSLAMAGLVGHYPFMDASYMVDRMRYAVAGATIYRDFEFSYGPLMLYPQVGLFLLLRPLGFDLHAAYYLWYVIAQAAGVLMIARVLREAVMSARARRSLFAAVATFAAISPTLGINYALVRFLPPFVLLPLVLRAARGVRGSIAGPAAAMGAVGLCLLVSPETGIALFGSIVLGLVWLAVRESPAFLWQAAIVALGAGVEVAVLGGTGILGAFLAGGMAFPVMPSPAVLLYVAAVMLAAWGSGAAARAGGSARGAEAAAWGALTVAMSAAAFGRADVGHLFWNGLGAWIAVPVALASMGRARLSVWWVRSFAVLYVGWLAVYCVLTFARPAWNAGIANGMIPERAVATISRWVTGRSDPLVANYRRVRAAVPTAAELAVFDDDDRVAAPLTTLGGEVVESLAKKGVMSAGYNAQLAVTADDVSRIVEGLDEADVLIVTRGSWDSYRTMPDLGRVVMVTGPVGTPLRYFALFGLPFVPTVRNPTLDPAASLGPVLARDWTERGMVGRYVLLTRKP
jgi:hypothetical protein